MKKTIKNTPMSRTAVRLRTNIGTRPLVLVGLMGAGKSTIGKRVAHMLELDFFDADIEIEHAAQLTIPELFSLYGEQKFRDLEKRVILRLLQKGPIVLATGGGAFINEETRKSIHNHGLSVWLNADLDTLMHRVSKRNTRPLLQTENPRTVMQKLMEERYPIYAEANLTIASKNARRDIIARNVIRSVDRYLAKPQEKNNG